MTGYTVHTGSTVKFSQGWDRIFPAAETAKADTSSKAESQSNKKKAAGKKAKKAPTKSKARPVKKAVKKAKK